MKPMTPATRTGIPTTVAVGFMGVAADAVDSHGEHDQPEADEISHQRGGSSLPRRTELTTYSRMYMRPSYHADASARRHVGEIAGAEGSSS
jgi:hypothetical protein